MMLTFHAVTLVEGPTDAHLVYDDPLESMIVSEDCAINHGIAVCAIIQSFQGTIVTDHGTQTATGFVVQGGPSTLTGGTGSSGSGAESTSSQPTAGSGATSGPSQTGGSGSAQTQSGSGSNNGAGKAETSAMLTLGLIGLVSAFFL